eukprot:CAMPEP_0184323782 /NCGR_PEP_ID=MMETSP1049-20130417/132069_1 /TAXON_ID=77928 /ORGANISM="Proteomonas sulcata, Strain CCMP704" /LENGTH=148 /DNA_ID=CAMNT_0026645369 /DNA_START=81 /DNA_END=524 /DNA_ORIENTATION=+
MIQGNNGVPVSTKASPRRLNRRQSRSSQESLLQRSESLRVAMASERQDRRSIVSGSSEEIQSLEDGGRSRSPESAYPRVITTGALRTESSGTNTSGPGSGYGGTLVKTLQPIPKPSETQDPETPNPSASPNQGLPGQPGESSAPRPLS